jgi:uncharacterized repeat protein (TIGR03833 family)
MNTMMNDLDGQHRKNIRMGQKVQIIKKNDQKTGKLTEGFVQRILTNSLNHPHGIKVQLKSGAVGRIKNIIN